MTQITGTVEVVHKCGHTVATEYGTIRSKEEGEAGLKEWALRVDCEACKYAARKWKLGVVNIDGGPSFPAYILTTQRWNGWVMPYFTKHQADAFIADQLGEQIDFVATYLADEDAYEINTDPANLEAPDKFHGEDITVDGQTIHVYPIGAGSWIWDEAEMPEEIQYASTDLVLTDKGQTVLAYVDRTAQIFAETLKTMHQANDMCGSQLPDYVALMDALIAECTERRNNAAALIAEVK